MRNDTLGLKFFAAVLLTGLMAACGGGGLGEDTDAGETTGSTTSGETPPTSSTPTDLSLTSDVTTLSVGASTANLTAVVTDKDGLTVSGVKVKFTSALDPVEAGAAKGALTVVQGTTDSLGVATATLAQGATVSGKTIKVTATVDSVDPDLTASVSINVISPPSYVMGTVDTAPDPDEFDDVIKIGDGGDPAGDPLSAGGSSALTLQIVDKANGFEAFPDPVTVNFSSPCATAGTASIPSVVSVNGLVTATYRALGCTGNDLITATAVVKGATLKATGTIKVAASTLGQIVFVKATPTTVAIKGTGDGTRAESSDIVFEVRNSSGGPVADQSVVFSLSTTAGGMSLSPATIPADGTATAKTDASGQVHVTLNAGTVHTSVRVRATTTNAGGTITLTGQSDPLTISTGLPDQAHFSMAAECFNMEALNRDGETTAITMRLADHYGNPVPDGTRVVFTAEGGSVDPNCTTTSGACSVTWTGQDPRPPARKAVCDGSATDTDTECAIGHNSIAGVGSPRAGRATILASTDGEETFIDVNGNGLFDSTEAFQDLPEAFRDDDENGSFNVAFEEPVDFNEDGSYTGVDGLYNGSLCSAPNANCAAVGNRSLSVRNSTVIVMSGSSPNLDPDDDVTMTGGIYDSATRTFIVTMGNTGFAKFVVRDVNKQPMAGGTTIAFEASDIGSITSTKSFTKACSIDDRTGANTYSFGLKATADAAATASKSGSAELTVTSKTKLSTIYGFGFIAALPPAIPTFGAIPATSGPAGTPVTVAWGATAQSCVATGGSGTWPSASKDTSGSQDFTYPAMGTSVTYTLKCANEAGSTATKSITVSGT